MSLGESGKGNGVQQAADLLDGQGRQLDGNRVVPEQVMAQQFAADELVGFAEQKPQAPVDGHKTAE